MQPADLLAGALEHVANPVHDLGIAVRAADGAVGTAREPQGGPHDLGGVGLDDEAPVAPLLGPAPDAGDRLRLFLDDALALGRERVDLPPVAGFAAGQALVLELLEGVYTVPALAW